MCFYVEYEGVADIYEETVVRTRRERRCYECDEMIPRGAFRFQRKSLYDGHWSQYHRCARCDFVVEMIRARELAEGCAEDVATPPERELADVLRDHDSWSYSRHERQRDPGYARKLGLLKEDGTPLELHEIPRF